MQARGMGWSMKRLTTGWNVLKLDVDGAFFFFQETKWNMVAMALLYYSAWILKALLGDDALKLQW